MDLIESHLNEAIYFMNKYSAEKVKAFDERDKWVNILTNDIILLDGTPSSDQRKEKIIALDNVLNQLEHLFDKDKKSLQIHSENIRQRGTYFPENKDSHYALKDSFSVGNKYMF